MSALELNSEAIAYATTPHTVLREQIMHPRIPKNEREWWAAREIARLERELNKANEALRFIAEWGGRTLESEYGDIDCNGKWCAEQAKKAVE